MIKAVACEILFPDQIAEASSDQTSLSGLQF